MINTIEITRSNRYMDQKINELLTTQRQAKGNQNRILEFIQKNINRDILEQILSNVQSNTLTNTKSMETWENQILSFELSLERIENQQETNCSKLEPLIAKNVTQISDKIETLENLFNLLNEINSLIERESKTVKGNLVIQNERITRIDESNNKTMETIKASSNTTIVRNERKLN
jgi:hypothetical protein